MSLYPELDNRKLDELERFFEGAPLDGPDTAVAFYQEVADKIAAEGAVGLDYLWRQLSTTDTPHLRALVLSLSRRAAGDSRLRPWLRSLLGATGEVAAEAIDGLARIGDADAKRNVTGMSTHASQYVRGAVLRFVCRVAPDEAWPLLEAGASDPHFIVRENAADEMAELGDQRAIPHLERLATDSHEHVRQAAQSALETLRPDST